MDKNQIKFVLEKIEQAVDKRPLQEKEHILSHGKYQKRFKQVVAGYINTFAENELLSKEEIKGCLKQLYKSL